MTTMVYNIPRWHRRPADRRCFERSSTQNHNNKFTKKPKKMSESYKLQHPGSCTGMFWREDPRKDVKKEKQVGADDWPRNGSILTGKTHKVDGEDWLEVNSWKQANSETKIDSKGTWMPFQQGGLLLHKL
mmetsp:Transcript_16743/g.28927  ORF Transcript_16743/g.28927 Transcript_16743/m.28927 type:complete len:130 (+) Transcript_16743:2101-2490(+)